MKLIDCGTSGDTSNSAAVSWSELDLGAPWPELIDILAPNTTPRDVQREALADLRVLDQRKNLIVAAPTNGGKSLVGTLLLLDAVRRGGRAVLLEPLRALAREKADELLVAKPKIERLLGIELDVQITTGDYRLSDELMSDGPPESAQLVIATPERFDAILRNPEYMPWVTATQAVCIDEAHLISTPRRGPVIEYLITSLLGFNSPPRIILLSASLGNVSVAQQWLSPCEVVSVSSRFPPLQKFVGTLDGEDDANAAIQQLASVYLKDNSAALLVFVYRTSSAESLATELRESLPDACGERGPLAYHSQMSSEQRTRVREDFLSGRCRCVVTTTALGMGVNLPATHAIVRDVTFPGEGRLPVHDILQMIGRAGRGDQSGTSVVIVRENDPWDTNELIDAIQNEPLPELVSSFQRFASRVSADRSQDEVIATQIAMLLSRQDDTGVLETDIYSFFERSLGATEVVGSIGPGLSWLVDSTRLLAYRDENECYRLTALGKNATRATMPLGMAAGIGQLFRDILEVDPKDEFLRKWTTIDHLILLECLSDRSPSLRRFGERLAEQVDGWVESFQGVRPILYRTWIRGQKGASRAAELFGSLGIAADDDKSRRRSYLSVFRAIVLHERGHGVSAADIERKWGIKNLAGVEEKWRDQDLWLLSTLAEIIDTRCFYFTLKDRCQADEERVHRVESALRRMRFQTFELQQHLKYCSPLGGTLRSMRRVLGKRSGVPIGIGSIRRLEKAGISSITQLMSLSEDDLVDHGIRRMVAKQMRAYFLRRLR